MANFTPGPWHVNGTAICEGELGYGEIVAEVRPDCRVGDWFASACVMAAAPRMLALLHQLARRIENSHLTTEPGRASLMTHLPQEYDEIMETIEAAEGREG